MNVERTIQFLLESQAKHDSQIGAILTAQAKHQATIASMDKRLTKRIDGVTKLVKRGMKMLGELGESQRELARAQKDTERTLKNFIASIQNGGNVKKTNGH